MGATARARRRDVVGAAPAPQPCGSLGVLTAPRPGSCLFVYRTKAQDTLRLGPLRELTDVIHVMGSSPCQAEEVAAEQVGRWTEG